MVLTTEDANRTFLSYLGASQELHFSEEIAAAIASSRLLIIEGYLWEMPGAADVIRQAINVARACGALVALTAGDSAVVDRHRAELWGALRQGVDLLFMNRCATHQHGISALPDAAALGATSCYTDAYDAVSYMLHQGSHCCNSLCLATDIWHSPIHRQCF